MPDASTALPFAIARSPARFTIAVAQAEPMQRPSRVGASQAKLQLRELNLHGVPHGKVNPALST